MTRAENLRRFSDKLLALPHCRIAAEQAQAKHIAGLGQPWPAKIVEHCLAA